ncbi:caspase family protein [Flammeovirga agarivorans]|uniref:Peptidase C14 caspase domain-containing protein n=1 Tax=Flammeovirga agarivorans TaxID=2726742 RepID=A0A7X8SL62_9BACT|nr:caspase family protein [Flammeovirga agarivorans]NLR92249.1 hypothetical protein [Flammeovirga agarivorans]
MRKFLVSVLLLILSNSLIYAQDDSLHLVIDPQGHSSVVRRVIFSSDNHKVYSVSEDKTLRVWDVATGTLEATFWGDHNNGKEGRYNALAISPDNKLLAVGGYLPQNEIRIINLSTGKQIASLLGHENIISDLEFSSDGEYLASSSADKTVRIWYIPFLDNDVFEEEPFENFRLQEHTNTVYNLDFSEDGTRLVTCSFDGTVRMYSLSVGMKSATIMKVWETDDRFTNVDISLDNKYVVAGNSKGKVFVWNTNGTEVATLIDPEGFITSLNFSDDSEKLLLTDAKGNLFFYDTEAWLKDEQLSSDKGVFFYADFAKGNKNYCVASNGSNGNIEIWDIPNQKIIRSFEGQGVTVNQLSKISDESIAFASLKDVELNFNFSDVDLKYPQAKNEVEGLSISKDGQMLNKTGSFQLDYNGVVIKNDRNRDKDIRAFGFLGDKIVVGSGASLKAYQLDGQLSHTFEGHSGSIKELTSLKNGRYLVSSSDDQTIKIWNIESGELLLTLFLSKSNEWVVWSPKGYYHASAGGEQYIGWLINSGLGELGEFHKVNFASKEFHRKDIIQQIFKKGSFQEVENAFNLSSVDIKDLAENRPQIHWVSPEMFTVADNNTVNIQAKVVSQLPVKTFKLLVDGRPLEIGKGLVEVSQDSGYVYEINESIEVKKHQTSLQLFVENEEVNIISSPRKISKLSDQNMDIGFDLKELTERSLTLDKSNIYLLSIGISNYQMSSIDLGYADKDATSIADLYASQNRSKVFNEVKIKKIINEEANKKSIIGGFDWLKQGVGENDLAIVFIAAHGVNYKGDFYIIPHDFSMNQIQETALKWDEFADVLSKLPSQVLLYVDACNSGQLGSNFSSTNNTEDIRKLSSDENGVVIMSGSTGSETSLESEQWGHGAFTAAILEGLGQGKADYSGDQIITLRELDLFVAMKVKELTENKQHPTTQKPSTISTMNVGEFITK